MRAADVPPTRTRTRIPLQTTTNGTDKMPRKARKIVRLTKFLLAVVTVFCVSWIASVNEWHAVYRRAGPSRGLTTMRTIVGYSEEKLAEMERPAPLTCDRLPAFPDIPQINRTWIPESPEQPWQLVSGTTVFLYAAYYDDRTTQKYVRILANFHGRNISTEETLFCQTRSMNPDEEFIEVVAAKSLEIWWHEWDSFSTDVETPLLISCPLTEPLYSPSVVSIVTQPCDDPTNAFALDTKSKRDIPVRKFTVCVKDMNFDKDISSNIIEWVETNKLLGVDIIDLYIDTISEETETVLQYYRDKGFVRLFSVPIRYKRNRTLWQRRRDHVVTYNDCLYRNIMESEFIIPLDVDEIIIPKKADDLTNLLTHLTKYGWDSSQHSAIMIRNVFFFDFMQGVDKYKKQRHMSKSKIYTKRDDVRIKDSDDLDIGVIELVGEVDSITNEVLSDRVIENHRSRCGYKLPMPKIGKNIVSSALVSPIGSYTKSLMVTKKVLTAFNHYPLASLGAAGFTGWAAPFSEVQINHYKESCNSTLVAECARYGRRARIDRSASRLYRRLAAALTSALCTQIKKNN